MQTLNSCIHGAAKHSRTNHLIIYTNQLIVSASSLMTSDSFRKRQNRTCSKYPNPPVRRASRQTRTIRRTGRALRTGNGRLRRSDSTTQLSRSCRCKTLHTDTKMPTACFFHAITHKCSIANLQNLRSARTDIVLTILYLGRLVHFF